MTLWRLLILSKILEYDHLPVERRYYQTVNRDEIMPGDIAVCDGTSTN